MAKIELKGLQKTYANGHRAVQALNIDIDHGEMLVLVGPSGCGKSTLLRMIAGLEPITEGELLINGERVNEREPGERDIAMVFQNYALYPHMTVFDNMAYGLKVRGLARAAIRARVEETASLLELEALLERRPRQLSGGQRQRVAMGRAIVRNPRLFLFDEPLSNLDAKLRGQMRLEIKRLQRKLNTTAVYVTHDQVEAMTLADRLVVLNQGRVEQVGRPMDIYRRPASLFVAQFIGAPAMNILPASVEGNSLLLEDGQRLTLAQRYQEGKVMLGLRPEQLRLQGPGLPISIAPVMTEMLGAECLYYCRLPGTQQQLVARLDDISVLPQPQNLVIGAEHLHLFSAETGRRLEPEMLIS